ncbi:MAG: Gfo/Idh/MocA family oxidoreductase [Verrucomicrobiaceae bacterium]|nr:Gfo/Idh/MocA family oxidoreductase [Verrucomicrobiaceae bacterium]
MNQDNTNNESNAASASRRGFLRSAVVAGAAGALSVERSAWAAGSDEIKIAMIGSGGRGSGAGNQALSNPAGGVRLVAIGDLNKENLDKSLSNLRNAHADKVDVPENRQHVGLDAYKRVLDSDANYVILATPPGFRPYHFEAAVNAGKNVFMEKPVAVDAPGVRKVHEMAKIADEKGLKVAVGLQRRYQPSYRAAFKAVKDGVIGDITGGQVYWNGGGIWFRDKKEGQSEIQYQMQNWYFFTWLCGDHINEQHIHNIDVANWFLTPFVGVRNGAPGPFKNNTDIHFVHDATPVTAQGMGGRQQRVDKKFGQIYDHHYVEFTYANGVRINSQCRHQAGTNAEVREEFSGSKGTIYLSPGSARAVDYKGNEIWKYEPAKAPEGKDEPEKKGPDKKRRRNAGGGDADPYQVEHNELQQAIREKKYLNNAWYGADSTMSAVMGRMATYSGKKITWEEAYNSKVQHMPAIVTNETEAPVKPDADGWYPIAIPGVTKEGII